MYQWLLFDADNTLFDFNLAEQKSLEATFRHFDSRYENGIMSTYKKINHEVWSAFERGELSSVEIRPLRFEKLFDALQLAGDAVQWGEMYAYQLGQCPELLPGADALLEAVAPHFRLGMITNGLTAVQRSRLALSPIEAFFDPIIISEEVGVKKPEPAIFELAFAQMDNPSKHEVLMIGDSLSSDIQGGINFGIDTCWYNPTERSNANNVPVTYEVTNYDALLSVLGVEVAC